MTTPTSKTTLEGTTEVKDRKDQKDPKDQSLLNSFNCSELSAEEKQKLLDQYIFLGAEEYDELKRSLSSKRKAEDQKLDQGHTEKKKKKEHYNQTVIREWSETLRAEIDAIMPKVYDECTGGDEDAFHYKYNYANYAEVPEDPEQDFQITLTGAKKILYALKESKWLGPQRVEYNEARHFQNLLIEHYYATRNPKNKLREL